jgi:hypothetical protein
VPPGTLRVLANAMVAPIAETVPAADRVVAGLGGDLAAVDLSGDGQTTPLKAGG